MVVTTFRSPDEKDPLLITYEVEVLLHPTEMAVMLVVVDAGRTSRIGA
jgi:hypothetical protein